MSDDDCYAPFYAAMKADFDNDAIIQLPIQGRPISAKGKGDGRIKARRRVIK